MPATKAESTIWIATRQGCSHSKHKVTLITVILTVKTFTCKNNKNSKSGSIISHYEGPLFGR